MIFLRYGSPILGSTIATIFLNCRYSVFAIADRTWSSAVCSNEPMIIYGIHEILWLPNFSENYGARRQYFGQRFARRRMSYSGRRQ